MANADRERNLIESLPGIFKNQHFPIAADMMSFWLRGKSLDGTRGWDYDHGSSKGVLLREEELRALMSHPNHERLRQAIGKLHQKFLEPKTGLLGEFFSHGFPGFPAGSLKAARQDLYRQFKAMAPGQKKRIDWGDTVLDPVNPQFLVAYEEVDNLQLPAKSSQYYPVYVDDLGVALGRFSVRAYASGVLSKQETTGTFDIAKVGIRIFDQFSFEKKILPFLSQPLGKWSKNGLEHILGTRGIYLNDAAFVNYKERYNKGNDFFVFSRVYEFQELSRLCPGLNLKAVPAFPIPLSEKDVLQYRYDPIGAPKY